MRQKGGGKKGTFPRFPSWLAFCSFRCPKRRDKSSRTYVTKMARRGEKKNNTLRQNIWGNRREDQGGNVVPAIQQNISTRSPKTSRSRGVGPKKTTEITSFTLSQSAHGAMGNAKITTFAPDSCCLKFTWSKGQICILGTDGLVAGLEYGGAKTVRPPYTSSSGGAMWCKTRSVDALVLERKELASRGEN